LLFFVGPVSKGHVVVTLAQLEWHMTIVILWKLIGWLKVITSCFCTGVSHCSQLHRCVSLQPVAQACLIAASCTGMPHCGQLHRHASLQPVAQVCHYSQLHRHASLQPVAQMCLITASCTDVPHCSQLHINPEMMTLYTLKYVNSYTYFGQCLSSFWPNVLIVSVYADFWTKYVTPKFHKYRLIDSEMYNWEGWRDSLLLETILNVDCCNFRPHSQLMYNYSSVTVMGVARAVRVVRLSWGGAESKGKAKYAAEWILKKLTFCI
jgi:hypothetical protein